MQNERIRVTAQLISAADGYHVWSETYDEPFEQIFTIQERISARIAAALQSSVLEIEVSAPDPEAYFLTLRARYHGRRLTSADLETAIELYESALAIAPDYAAAWEGLSNAYINQAGHGRPTEEAYELARSAALRSVELEPDNAGWIQSPGANSTGLRRRFPGRCGIL